MRAPVRAFFDQARASLDAASGKIAEIAAMMETMVRRFSTEHGLALALPAALSLERYRSEIDAIEAIYLKQFGTATLLITSRGTLLERFFDSIASRVKFAFREANGDAEAWLKVVMAPLEAQIRQHRDQLRHRQASIQRILDATDSLEQKIAAFESARADLDQLRARLDTTSAAVAHALREHAAQAPEPETTW
jgi:exonuclease VII small subunit